LVAAYINQIGTAVPAFDVHDTFVGYASSLFSSQRARRLFDKMVERSQIDHRYSFLQPDLTDTALDRMGFYQRGRFPHTGRRMRFFEQHALALARLALDDLGLETFKREVTHLIVATCTGFYAPGLDLEIVEHCDLNTSVERTILGFMGCSAAIPALRLARHIVRSDPQARVVVVNLELCTIHLQETEDLEQILCFLLWGDGCSAALVSAEATGIELSSFHTTMIPHSRHQMAWHIGKLGFQMLLSGQVPLTLARELPRHVKAILGGRRVEDIALWALHPGGRSLVDALGEALGLHEDALRYAREVLRRFGNMSSATIMFVLSSMLRAKSASGLGCGMAFGPGLAAESMIFQLAA
jgi:alpha-pyrone synthase